MSARNKPKAKYLRKIARWESKADPVLTPPRNPAVKVALKLSRLPLHKLHRRLAQTARRAATCRYLIASLSPNSMFSVGIKAAQKHELFLLRQVRAEITSRIPKTK